MTLGVLRPGMRGYFVPLAAGIALVISAFLPWVIVGDVSLKGVPDMAALWVAGLGALAAILAALSLVTRRNSRHPLLIIGLVALGIMFLSWRIMPTSAGDRALTLSQAFAIVEGTPVGTSRPVALAGSGIYLGLAASVVLVCFGLTIVIKRASNVYVVSTPDDDVD
jgi:FtsH-binding integral membrane protein